MQLLIVSLQHFYASLKFSLLQLYKMSMIQIKAEQENITQSLKVNLENQRQTEKGINFLSMYRFSSKRDKFYLFLGILGSMIIGAAFPIFSLLWGNMIDSFANKNSIIAETLKVLWNYLEIGAGAFVVGWIMNTSFAISASRQGGKCRSQYLKAVMLQQSGWFQSQQQSSLNLKLSSLVYTYEAAIGDKISNLLSNIFLFIAGMILSLIKGWLLSLVIIGFCPFLIYSWKLMMDIHTNTQKIEEEVSLAANSKAQETLGAIKIVKQLNTSDYQINRYKGFFEETKTKMLNHAIKLSWIQLFSQFCFFAIFALAFWFGSECVKGSNICPSNQIYTSGGILSIFFCLLLPAVNIQQIFPCVTSLNEGKKAFQKIIQVIYRTPEIKSSAEAIIPEKFIGVFQFDNVTFAYPKDKNKVILNGLTLEINCKNTGIMGPSGTGKSTIFQLMMRLYDPDSGTVLLDGVDLKKLDLSWLRGQISYVSQEPLLFSASIRENLLIGKPAASEEELWSALKKAEIAQFVKELKEGLQSFVGNGGCQLSGGQKQRLAIARALLKDPKVILLDEASSALDNRNQKLIQDTLNKISNEKIIVSIAHRVSTVQNCDQICLIQSGTLSKKMSFKQSRENFQNPTSFQSVKIFQSFEQLKNQQEYNYIINTSKRSLQQSSILLNENFISEPIPKQQIQIDDSQEINQQSPFCRLLSYAKGNYLILIFGSIIAIAHGFTLPSIGLFLARILSYCLQYSADPSYYSSKLQKDCIIMVIISILGAITNKLLYRFLMTVGERVNNVLQVQIFEKLLKMPIQWFDKEQNSPHKIANNVLNDGKIVKQYFSVYFPHILPGISSILFGLIFAIFYQWRTALVAIVLMPLFGAVVGLQSSYTYGNSSTKNEIYKESESTLSQSIKNIKTIQSFCCQAYILHRYEKIIDKAVKSSRRTAIISGFAFGLSYIVLYSIYGILFYLSSVFTVNHDVEIADAFSAIFLVIFAGTIAGSNLKLVPSLLKIKISAINIFKIIDKIDQYQLRKGDSHLKTNKITGDIQFRNVSFRYSNRDEWALKSVSFSVKAGEKVGLVGASGCGKSTIIQLILRFYEPSEGIILVDGINIKQYDVDSLRRHFGIVSQEATLFDETVKYNLLYGNERITEEELNKFSNLLISSSSQSIEWRDFLQQKVGPRGSHISGGQKQRISIVRTALRKPSVLLLDEATSALDAQNAILVEECLTQIIDERTVLNVTHNLQGLRQYPHIIVLQKGTKIQQGSFKDLEAKKGKFNGLLNTIIEA